jgi:hypothetical protein
MDPPDRAIVDSMVRRHTTLARLAWATAATIFAGTVAFAVVVGPELVIMCCGAVFSSLAAAGARAASRKAKLVSDGVDTSDLDLDF